MYCVRCGKEVVGGGKFCVYCGAQLPMLEETQESEVLRKPEAIQELSKESIRQSLTWEEAIGRNVFYYTNEFRKVESGGKAKFNWAAFLFNASFCLYRKCGNLYKEYFLAPVLIVMAACLVVSIGTAKFSLTAMLVGSIGSAVGSIWAFVNSIRVGKQFNAEYYSRCKDTITSGNKENCGTTLAVPILYNAALVIAVLLCSFVGTLFGGPRIDDLPDMDSWNVSGGGAGIFGSMNPSLSNGKSPDATAPSDSVLELSSGELGDIQLFLNRMEYNGFLQSAYNDARDILLTPIFYNYEDPSVDYDMLERGYLALGNELYVGLVYVSSSTLERIIQEKTGYELAEMNNLYLSGFTYVPSVDAYCRQVSDTYFNPVNCLSGSKVGNIYTVIYESDFDGDWYYETADGAGFASTMTVTLRDSDSGWQFVSNVPNE